jgi:sialate O-acetylesterase
LEIKSGVLKFIYNMNMVIQRDMKVPIWGTADAEEAVAVEFNGQSVATTAAADGKWKIELAPMEASTESKSLTVKV